MTGLYQRLKKMSQTCQTNTLQIKQEDWNFQGSIITAVRWGWWFFFIFLLFFSTSFLVYYCELLFWMFYYIYIFCFTVDLLFLYFLLISDLAGLFFFFSTGLWAALGRLGGSRLSPLIVHLQYNPIPSCMLNHKVYTNQHGCLVSI